MVAFGAVCRSPDDFEELAFGWSAFQEDEGNINTSEGNAIWPVGTRVAIRQTVYCLICRLISGRYLQSDTATLKDAHRIANMIRRTFTNANLFSEDPARIRRFVCILFTSVTEPH